MYKVCYVCIYMCIYVYIYVCVCVCVYIYMCVCIYIYIYIYIYMDELSIYRSMKKTTFSIFLYIYTSTCTIKSYPCLNRIKY